MAPSLLLFAGAPELEQHTVVIAQGRSYTYRALRTAAARVAAALLAGAPDLGEARVAILVPPGFDYAAALYGTWLAGGVAVPLCLQHPPPEWDYVLDDAGAA